MTNRDELADIAEDETRGVGQPGPAHYAIADRILARWRLVPVDGVVTFVNHPAGTPCPEQHRAADELTHHDRPIIDSLRTDQHTPHED